MAEIFIIRTISNHRQRATETVHGATEEIKKAGNSEADHPVARLVPNEL
jgi:hypothetical protein